MPTRRSVNSIERLLGAHVSIAGGVDMAPERGRLVTCNVIQLFTKSNVQWRAAPITDEERTRFLANLPRCGIQLAFAHSCYLLNLCSPNPVTRRRSREALRVEIERCVFLRLPYLVIHPGAHGGLGEREAIKWIADGIAAAADTAARLAPMILLETTSGQGSSIGWRFEQLAELIGRLRTVTPVGVCFDTCHVFAAGYDLRGPEAFAQTMAEFDRTVGCNHIRAFHLNDSRGELGSRLDRHEHIGKGRIGNRGFAALLNDPRFADRPMVIETPKGEGVRFDLANLRRLRRLICRTTPSR